MIWSGNGKSLSRQLLTYSPNNNREATGSRHIGVSAVTESKELYAGQVELRDGISESLAQLQTAYDDESGWADIVGNRGTGIKTDYKQKSLSLPQEIHDRHAGQRSPRTGRMHS